VRGDGPRQHASAPAPGPHVRERDGEVGSPARGLELELDRRGPRVQVRPAVVVEVRGDRELEFWWDSLAYWDDYVAGTRTFDREGAGIAGVERDRYFHNRGGARAGAPLFEDRAFLDGLDLESNGRAAIAFDANEDGALDLYVRSVGSPEALFLGSREPDEHFLRLRLAGEPGRDNRDGIGARIVARPPGGRAIVTENANASGYLSTGSPIVHLGLGAATRLDALTVRWPSGRVQELGAIAPVDRVITVDGARGIVAPSPAPK